jgi:CelD/BcsL family acetyltransferase involved in cellulose biosynthesis
VTEVCTLQGLELLANEWSDLTRNCTESTPFQSPDWLISWWRHLPQGELWVLSFRKNGKLLGIAPFFIEKEQVLLMGAGVSDYSGLVYEPSARREVTTALAGHLASATHRWQACHFQHLRTGSSLLEIETPAQSESRVLDEEPCPAVNLDVEKRTLQTCIPASTFQKLQYYRRRLSRLGSWRIVAADHSSFPEMFDALVANHQARRATVTQVGAFSDSRSCRFHKEAAASLLSKGNLRLYGLLFNGNFAANLYAFRKAGTVYFYASGFDPAFSKLDLGVIMIGEALEQALREGLHTFDFLRGTENYKYRWGAHDQPVYCRQLTIRKQARVGCFKETKVG